MAKAMRVTANDALMRLLEECEQLENTAEMWQRAGVLLVAALRPQALYVWAEEDGGLRLSFAHPTLSSPQVPPSTNLWHRFQHQGQIIHASKLYLTVGSAERDWLDSYHSRLIVPVGASGSGTVGVVILGPKSSGREYRRDRTPSAASRRSTPGARWGTPPLESISRRPRKRPRSAAPAH